MCIIQQDVLFECAIRVKLPGKLFQMAAWLEIIVHWAAAHVNRMNILIGLCQVRACVIK
jgi:hypothetical protein